MDNHGYHNNGPDDSGRDNTLHSPACNSAPAEDDWGDFGPGFGGDPEGDIIWVDVVPEVDGEQPRVAVKELSDAQKNSLSIAVKRFERFGGRTKAAVGGKTDHTGYITHEDFEPGPQQEAFMLIYGQALNLFEPKSKLARDRSIEFFFCYNPEALTFDDASATISEDIRRDVFRLRVMYEFWLGWYILEPLPFNVAPLPLQVEGWASAAAGLAGVAVSQVVWQNPSVSHVDAVKLTKGRLSNVGVEISDRELVLAIDNLKANYILSAQGQSLYLTGKNPVQEIQDQQLDPNIRHKVQSNSWWSRLFSQ